MPSPRLPRLLLLALFAVVITQRAWLSDDAYITFRTVDNFINGYGLTWNTAERVQAYTHPLWMLLLSGLYALTREIHLTSLLFSLAVSLAAVTLFALRLPRSQTAALFGLLALTLSKAYVDFATSGLENPLANLLLVLFALQLLRLPTPSSPSAQDAPLTPNPQLTLLSLTASLGLLTRLDLALVFAPGLLYAWWHNRTRRGLYALALGQIPLLAWEAFSLFYYGFPLPNTFYAKLNTGIPQAELTYQGFLYLLNALEFDPLTPLLILTGLAVALYRRNPRELLIAGGVLLYLAYVVRIGGDFMAGRFLAAPLLLSVVLITRLDFDRLPPATNLLLFGLILALGLRTPHATLAFDDPTLRQPPQEHVDPRGISDERLNYAPFTGLLALRRGQQLPSHVWAWQGRRDAGKGRTLIAKFAIGFYGFEAGPGIHVIDQLALADPLLARLPAARDLNWRIGHFIRPLPDGYLKSLQTGQNRLKDPQLAQLYDALRLITRGPLLSRTRLLEIWKINTGHYDQLIDFDRYRYPDMLRLTPSGDTARTPTPPGTPQDAPGNLLLTASGLEIVFPAASRAPVIALTLSSDDAYLLRYFRGPQLIAEQRIPPPEYPEDGLALHTLNVPPAALQTGYDRLRLFPLQGAEPFAFGHLTLTGEP